MFACMCPKCLWRKITSRKLNCMDMILAQKLRSRSGCHKLWGHHIWKYLFGTCFAVKWPELKAWRREDNGIKSLLSMPNLLMLEDWEHPFLLPSSMLGILFQGGQDLSVPFLSMWEARGRKSFSVHGPSISVFLCAMENHRITESQNHRITEC